MAYERCVACRLTIRWIVPAVFICLIMAPPAAPAATYYVSPTGLATNPGTQAQPWSMAKANSDLTPGDTAILMDGVYTTGIYPANSGTVGGWITYKAANSRQAAIIGFAYPDYPINVSDRSYIVVDGVKSEDTHRWVYGNNSHHITINDCYFRNGTGWESARFRETGGYIRVTNCHIESGSDSLHIREGEGHYIAGNTFIQASHTCLVIMGIRRSVIENNRLTNMGQKCMEVFSMRQVLPPDERKSEYNLFQGNWFGPTTSSGIQYAGNYSILRRNIFDDCSVGMNWANYGGTDPGDDPEAWWDEHNRFYNNVLYDCDKSMRPASLSRTWPLGGSYGDNVHVNNIVFKGSNARQVDIDWDSRPEHVSFYYNSIMRTAPGQNVFWWTDGIYENPPMPQSYSVSQMEAAFPADYANNMEFDPQFVDAPGDDFHLQPTSPCIDAGGPLTTTASAGSGTVVPVVDALYFTDGYGLVAADVIRIGGRKATIVSVDYGANALTIDQGMSWSAGEWVCTDYSGAGPDLGAYETSSGSQVAGRYVFYNNSAFDGNDPAANPADDNAIASDKTALLPGGTAGLANYTSYCLGINGIMVDIDGLGGTPTAADFAFKVGNDSSPGAWATAPAPVSVTVRPAAGAGGSDRITIIWADESIRNKWLCVTVLATANTALGSPDVFYFGNAIGETGNCPDDARVTPTDVVGVRNNPHTIGDPAPVEDSYDFDRDLRVGPTDEVLARNSGTNSQTALQLITVP